MTLAPIDSCLYLFNGINWIGMGGAGTNCNCGFKNMDPDPEFPCGGTVIPIVDVISTTGKIWMDRNLGASQVATASDDAAAYGDLYQWGRCSDGHEKRNSGTTSTLSTSDDPGHGDFIMNISSPYDWRNPQNDNLWQGASGTNNPCPTGYRLPTESELRAEMNSWSTQNAFSAFDSPLKLTVACLRRADSGSLDRVDSSGFYWSSTVSGIGVWFLWNQSSSGVIFKMHLAQGLSVRCIKD